MLKQWLVLRTTVASLLMQQNAAALNNKMQASARLKTMDIEVVNTSTQPVSLNDLMIRFNYQGKIYSAVSKEYPQLRLAITPHLLPNINHSQFYNVQFIDAKNIRIKPK